MTENDHRSRSRSNAEGYLSFPKTKGHFAEENCRFFITVKTEFLRRLRPSEQRHGNDPLGAPALWNKRLCTTAVLHNSLRLAFPL